MRKLLTGLALSVILGVPQAYAGVIATPVDNPSPARERVNTLIERPEVAQQLEKMGIPAGDAKARVAAMTEEEVMSLAGKLDSLPAGGALSNQDFLLVIVIILLVIILL